MQGIFSNEIFPAVHAWVLAHGLKVVFIVGAAAVLQYAGGVLTGHLVNRFIERGAGSKGARVKRANTLVQVLGGAWAVIVWLVAAMMLLSEFGVAIGPILAAAGVVGIAVGFGSQYVIRDLITGLFLIIENQYRIGDVVCFDTTCGLVEGITLRMTTLRDMDGTVYHIPNGEIKRVSNRSKGFSRVNLDVGVAYEADLKHVIEVVNTVGKELAEDEAWKDKITKAPAFLRVNDFGDSAVIIKILGETRPREQWNVAGELRLRLKLAFDEEGIEIPYPQRVIRTVEVPSSRKK